MAPLVLRPAAEADPTTMIALRREAETRLAGRGTEQWTARWTHASAERLQRATRQGRAHVVEVDGEVGATVTDEPRAHGLGRWEAPDLTEARTVRRGVTG
jgi:hypothetical protein